MIVATAGPIVRRREHLALQSSHEFDRTDPDGARSQYELDHVEVARTLLKSRDDTLVAPHSGGNLALCQLPSPPGGPQKAAEEFVM